jgi:hypothetical protein
MGGGSGIEQMFANAPDGRQRPGLSVTDCHPALVACEERSRLSGIS